MMTNMFNLECVGFFIQVASQVYPSKRLKVIFWWRGSLCDTGWQFHDGRYTHFSYPNNAKNDCISHCYVQFSSFRSISDAVNCLLFIILSWKKYKEEN